MSDAGCRGKWSATFHRTSVRPASARMAAVLLLTTYAVLLTPAHGLDLDSLLARSVGGQASVEKLRTVSSIHATGEIRLNGFPGAFDMYVCIPDMLYLSVDLGTYTLVQAYDGVTAWQQDHNGSVSELSGYERRALLGQAYIQSYSFLFDDRMPGGREYMGLARRGGEVYHEVTVYPSGADTLYAYFDTANGLKRLGISYQDNLETVTTSEDYRWVDDILVSFHSRSVAAAAAIESEFIVDQVLFNPSFDRSIFSRPTATVQDFRFPATSDSVVVPFEFVSGHIYLPVTINGTKRVRLILDSGASANIFHSPALEGLNLPVVGRLPAKGVGGYEEVQMVRTDSLTVGELVLYSQVAGSLDLAGISRPTVDNVPFGGILGYDFLSRFPILVNYQDHTLTVYDPDGFVPPEKGSEVGFRLTMQVPTIRAELVGIPGDFIVDLGNAYGLIIHHDFCKSGSLEERLDDVKELPRTLGGVGGDVGGKSAYAATFSFGDIRVTSLRVMLSQASEGLSGSSELAGNIGNLLLQQFHVLFDYRSKRLIFYDTQERAN